MNTLIIAGILLLWLFLGYKIYGNFIEKKVVLQIEGKGGYDDPSIKWLYIHRHSYSGFLTAKLKLGL